MGVWREGVLTEGRCKYPVKWRPSPPHPSCSTSPSRIFPFLKLSPLNLKTQCDELKYPAREGSVSSSSCASFPHHDHLHHGFLSLFLHFTLPYFSLCFHWFSPDCFHSFPLECPFLPNYSWTQSALQPTVIDLWVPLLLMITMNSSVNIKGPSLETAW